MAVLSLYTTIYPGVERYLGDWYRSLVNQTDHGFQVWIGLDTVEVDAAKEAMGGDPEATWIPSAPGDTPAQIRQRALTRVVGSCDAVVLVDSDDAMHPSRVASARVLLRTHDLVGCALRLVDERGNDLGASLRLPLDATPEAILPRCNLFGLSNSAFRSDLLRRCLPIPAGVTLVDWFLATRAWLLEARFAFDNETLMDYRQHGGNMVRVVPPFDEAQVTRDTERARRHFRVVQASFPYGAALQRRTDLARVAADVDTFHRQVVMNPERLEQYVQAINALGIAPLWGSSVANPILQHMWTSEEETA